MSFSLKDPSVLMNTCIHCWNQLSSQNKVAGKSNQSRSDKSRIIIDKKRMAFFLSSQKCNVTIIFVKKQFSVLSLMGSMCIYILDLNQFYSWLCAD